MQTATGMAKRLAHETLIDSPTEMKTSERRFGLLFLVVLGAIGAWQVWQGGVSGPYWLAAAAVFGALALAWPRALRPLNLAWFKLGLLLHIVVSPLVIGAMFFLTVVPTGLIMRLLGKDPLRLKFDPKADSYWIKRDPPGPEPGSLKNQF